MGGYTNECGKFYSNPTANNPFSSSPPCSEKEIFEYKKKSLEMQIKLNKDRGEDNTTLLARKKKLQDQQAKGIIKKYLIYGLIVVGGYFAYKKFKK